MTRYLLGRLLEMLVVLLALIFLLTAHWILFILFGVAAAASVAAFLQLRKVH